MKRLFRPIAHAVSAFKRRNSVLLIPPTSFVGSTGDTAMSCVVVQYFRKRHGSVDVLGLEDLNLDSSAPDQYLDPGSYLRWGPVRAPYRLLPKLARYERAFLIGADIIDGVYDADDAIKRINVLGEAATLGAQATVLGASFNSAPHPGCIAALRGLPSSVTICARDPASKVRMEGALERPIRLVADLAFLTPLHVGHPALVPLRAWREKQSSIVGLNINNLQVQAQPGLVDAVHSIARQLLAQGHSLMLIPHDVRGEPSDVSLLRDLERKLDSDRVQMLNCRSPGAIKCALSYCDALLTGRMHAAILAFSTHTPVVSLAYQDKFAGLYASLGLENEGMMLTPRQAVTDPLAVVRAVENTLGHAGRLSGLIAAHFSAVQQLAQENFQQQAPTTPASMSGARVMQVALAAMGA
jgi:polysaccharide pyruvyl transferase WcaK-like protein